MSTFEASTLAARSRADLVRLRRQAERAIGNLDDASAGTNPEKALELAGYEMATYYTGLERLFEAVARDVDRAPVSGASWYQDLLDQMRLHLNGRRPPVVTAETALGLTGLLQFRRVMRSTYALELDLQRIASLGRLFGPLTTAVEQELDGFAVTLDGLGSGSGS